MALLLPTMTCMHYVQDVLLTLVMLYRCDNIFKDLDNRALTTAEQCIIEQRVALQRRMLEEYEKREKARKACGLALESFCASYSVQGVRTVPSLWDSFGDWPSSHLSIRSEIRCVHADCGHPRPVPLLDRGGGGLRPEPVSVQVSHRHASLSCSTP